MTSAPVNVDACCKIFQTGAVYLVSYFGIVAGLRNGRIGPFQKAQGEPLVENKRLDRVGNFRSGCWVFRTTLIPAALRAG